MFEATRSVSGRVVRVRPVDSAGALDAGAPPADDVDGSFVVLVDVLVDDADDSESSAQARAPRAAFDARVAVAERTSARDGDGDGDGDGDARVVVTVPLDCIVLQGEEALERCMPLPESIPLTIFAHIVEPLLRLAAARPAEAPGSADAVVIPELILEYGGEDAFDDATGAEGDVDAVEGGSAMSTAQCVLIAVGMSASLQLAASAQPERSLAVEVSVLLCTVTFNANLAHNLTRSP